MKRSILFVSNNFPPVTGGSSVVYDQMCRQLSQDIVALCPARHYSTGEPYPDLAARDAERGYPIHRVSHLRPPLTTKRLGRFSSLLLHDIPIMLRALAAITALILRHGSRVVCLGELLSNGWLVFPLRYLLRRRVLIYTHGEEVSQEDNSLAGRLRGVFLAHAHVIVSVSDFCKGQIISRYGIPAERIFVVPNGVDLNVFRRGERDRSVLPEAIRGKRILLSVSRLVERKGQEKLIQAMPEVVAPYPDAHCVIVGEGPLAAHLRQVAVEEGVAARVTFMGAVSLDDLVRLYQASDLFVLPCRTLADGDTEGFGLVFLEANACGLPVVAGAAGGTIEAVADGETGLVVDGYSAAEIAQAILKLLHDPDLSRRLAEIGWTRSQAAGWEHTARNFLDVCRDRAVQPVNRSYRPRSEARAFLPSPHENERTQLLLTVDVEEQFDWGKFSSTEFSVDGQQALAEFHASSRGLGISPVYLVTHAIMANPAFAEFFRAVLAEGAGEVGIHLHSWSTPPHWETLNSFNSFQCNLPEHVERRKLESMCRCFEETFGRPARIHRAGRWGGSDRTADLLENLGIEVDLSPSPYFHDRLSGGPDFRQLDHAPFWAGAGRRVLTIPASTARIMRGPGLRRHLPVHWPVLARFSQWINGTFGTAVRFSPEGQTVEGLATLAQGLGSRPVAVMTLHSTSLYSGGSPYATTPEEVSLLHQRCFATLRECLRSGAFQPATCGVLYRDAAGRRSA
ncbi:MAG: glycosyltransferase [Caulobacteraceae bacterium]